MDCPELVGGTLTLQILLLGHSANTAEMRHLANTAGIPSKYCWDTADTDTMTKMILNRIILMVFKSGSGQG